MDDLMFTPEDMEMRKCPMCGGEMIPDYEYGMCLWECAECGHCEEWK